MASHVFEACKHWLKGKDQHTLSPMNTWMLEGRKRGALPPEPETKRDSSCRTRSESLITNITIPNNKVECCLEMEARGTTLEQGKRDVPISSIKGQKLHRVNIVAADVIRDMIHTHCAECYVK